MRFLWKPGHNSEEVIGYITSVYSAKEVSVKEPEIYLGENVDTIRT